MKKWSVVLFLVVLLYAVYSWVVTVSAFGSYLINVRNISILLATIGLVLILTQFILASRIKVIEKGFGLDRMMRWHRLFGRVGLFCIFIHVVLILYYYLRLLEGIYFNIFIAFGLLALLGLTITAALASLYKQFYLAYETWRNIHLANYILFPLIIVHVLYFSRTGSLLYYLWIILAVTYLGVVIYRIVRIISIRTNPYTVCDLKQEAAGIWSLFFKGKKIDYQPGQFMFVQLLRNGQRSSAHPFTISASPTREHLSVTPKELGDFTSTIKDTRIGDQAFIDAPYGQFSFLNHDHGEFVFIAGGIGITPFISMLRYMYDQGIDRKVVLFWANRTEENLCFKEELAEMQNKLSGLDLIMVMSEQPDWSGEKGYLDLQLISEHLDTLDNKTFFICGPPPMSRAIIGKLKKRKIPSSRICSELFEL